MQHNVHGKHRPIAYASRTLNRAESNYSVTHQESLAVVWTLKHFWDIILGYPITVFTDYAAVTELFKGKILTGRLARWYLTIQEFNPTFRYPPGRANVVADSLSRNVPAGAITGPRPVINNFSFPELAAAQRRWASVNTTYAARSFTLWNRAMKQHYHRFQSLSNSSSYKKRKCCAVTGPIKKNPWHNMSSQSVMFQQSYI